MPKIINETTVTFWLLLMAGVVFVLLAILIFFDEQLVRECHLRLVEQNFTAEMAKEMCRR